MSLHGFGITVPQQWENFKNNLQATVELAPESAVNTLPEAFSGMTDGNCFGL